MEHARAKSTKDMTTDQHVTYARTDRPTAAEDHRAAGSRPDSDAGTQGAPPPARRFELSLTQILGGALAAMTAAALGSRLSVAGTVVGAALASIVAAVAGAVYTASLRSTRDRVRTVWGRAEQTDQPAVISIETGADGSPVRQHSTPVAATAAPAAPPTRPRLQWKSVVAGALAAFGIAVGALTAVELASGQALSGGTGTTITQVGRGTGATTPTPAPPSATSTPTASPSPSSSASDSPSPSGTPSPSPSGTPSGAPSASATPSDAAPSPAPEASGEVTGG
jgi:hypothetical protein